MVTAPPPVRAGRRGTWLGQSAGVVTSVCVSPHSACLVLLTYGKAHPRPE